MDLMSQIFWFWKNLVRNVCGYTEISSQLKFFDYTIHFCKFEHSFKIVHSWILYLRFFLFKNLMRNVQWGYIEISDLWIRYICKLSTFWKQKNNTDIISQIIWWEMYEFTLRSLFLIAQDILQIWVQFEILLRSLLKL